MPKVSIIMPVYNVEKYLRQCLDSVINQTLKDIEIICVDDGAKDSSGKILDEYAAKDNRIKVFHRQNGGYGKALNFGIDHSESEYIGIVEPDDWIEPDMYETLCNIISKNNFDFVKGSAYNYSTSGKITNEPRAQIFTTSALNKIINPIKYISSISSAADLWAGIYNRKFLDEKNIRFLETPGASYQDTSFWVKILLESTGVMFIDKAFYHYRVDNGNQSVKDCSKVFCICDEMHELDKRYANNTEAMKIINAIKLDKYAWNYYRLDKKGRKQFKKIYKDELMNVVKNKNYTVLDRTDNALVMFNEMLNSDNILYKVFSVKDIYSHKIITILGLKIKIKRKTKY